jgi:hypothetical protein
MRQWVFSKITLLCPVAFSLVEPWHCCHWVVVSLSLPFNVGRTFWLPQPIECIRSDTVLFLKLDQKDVMHFSFVILECLFLEPSHQAVREPKVGPMDCMERACVDVLSDSSAEVPASSQHQPPDVWLKVRPDCQTYTTPQPGQAIPAVPCSNSLPINSISIIKSKSSAGLLYSKRLPEHQGGDEIIRLNCL